VVGKINLVEKIAQLARIPMQDVDKLDDVTRSSLGRRAIKDSVALGEIAERELAAADAPAKAKAIVKEGLSEYFIFSIEGAETIPNGWSKRMRSLDANAVPFTIQYRYRPKEYGEQLVRMYLLKNDKDSKLGTSPLPDGVVRMFRNNGRGGLSYLTAETIKYIPIGDKIELNLGRDPNVQFELVKLRTARTNIWMQLNGVNAFRKVGQPGVAIEQNTTVAGWDDHEVYAQRLQNYTDKPIDVEIRRTFPGHVIFRSRLVPTLFDFQTVNFTGPVPAGKTADLLFEIVRHQGINAKQENVTLEVGEVAP
jgi:hypothetical protein